MSENSSDSNWRLIEKQKITSEGSFIVGGNKLRLTNVERKLWENITKADLIQYYHSVSEYILPHLKDRPLSLHIKNIGPTRPGFYIKDMEGRKPRWAKIFKTIRKHKKPGKRDVIEYLVCQNEATLLYMINLGCIDVNPWTSRVTSYLYPDYVVIDLDPSDDDFKKAIDAALAAKDVFQKYRLIVFPKTSGKSGMHLYIPCTGFTFPQSRTIAESICRQIHSLVPHSTTTEVSVSKRGSNLYLDPNQNDEADTVAAPYSVRPDKSPKVSTPLEWKEITHSLDPMKFLMNNMEKRLNKKGDLFEDVLDKKIAAKNSSILFQFLAEHI